MKHDGSNISMVLQWHGKCSCIHQQEFGSQGVIFCLKTNGLEIFKTCYLRLNRMGH